VQGLNAKLKQFEGIKDKIKDKAQLDEAGKILAEELKTLIPAFLAKYVKVAEGQQKQLVGVKAKAESIMNNINSQQIFFTPPERPIFRVMFYSDVCRQYSVVEMYSWGTHPTDQNGVPTSTNFAHGITVQLFNDGAGAEKPVLLSISDRFPDANTANLARTLYTQPSTLYRNYRRDICIEQSGSSIPFGRVGGANKTYATNSPRITVNIANIIVTLKVHHSFLENMRYGIHRRRLKPAAIYG
jgi:hypothetical protein